MSTQGSCLHVRRARRILLLLETSGGFDEVRQGSGLSMEQPIVSDASVLLQGMRAARRVEERRPTEIFALQHIRRAGKK